MKKKIELDELKQIENNLLKVFSKFCEDNGLRYYLTYGTLIGAVRHKGFIPWDDDIDVIMPRVDYEKFLTVFNSIKTNNNITLLSYESKEDYYLPFAKLIDNRTILKEDANVKSEIGVFIDVFPLDNLSNNYRHAVSAIKKGYFLNAKWVAKIINLNGYSSSFKKLLIIAVKHILKRKTIQELIVDLDHYASKRGSDDFTKYVGVVCGISRGDKSRVFDSDWFKDTVTVEFEGNKYLAPVGYDEMLKQLYGDYMQVPPEKDQVTQHSFEAWYKD